MTSGFKTLLPICVRRTVDWGKEPAFLAQLDRSFAPKVEACNATIQLPYHRFRQELRATAQANLEQVGGAVPSRWEEVPEGGLVAPVDDDDWVASQLVEVIQAAAEAEVVGLHWQQDVLAVPITAGYRLRLLLCRLIPGLKPRWLCATNSYVIRKGHVDPRCFTSHVAASCRFAQQPPGRIRVLPQRLSLHNRLYRRWRIPPGDLAWCRPALLRMEVLMSQLRGGTL